MESLLNLKRPFETRVELYCPGVFQRRRDDAAESCATAEQEAAMSLEEWLRHKSGSQVCMCVRATIVSRGIGGSRETAA